MNIVFTPTAWAQYIEWQIDDKKIVKRINDLIKDMEGIAFTPFETTKRDILLFAVSAL